MPSNAYAPERLEKIAQIMPSFASVAQKGDVVYRGLEGDPNMPAAWTGPDRPTAVIDAVTRTDAGIDVTLKFANGETRVCNEHETAGASLWEFTDQSFEKVMERERQKYDPPQPASSYRNASDGDLRGEVEALRSLVRAEQKRNRSFHNTYIASMRELAADVCRMDVKGNKADFCRTFNVEFDKAASRSEGALRDLSDSECCEEEEELSEFF